MAESICFTEEDLQIYLEGLRMTGTGLDVEYEDVDWSAYVDDPTNRPREVLYKVRNAPAHFEEVNEDNHEEFIRSQIEQRRAEMQNLARQIKELEEEL